MDRDLPGMALNLADLAALAPASERTRRLYRLARRIFAAPPWQSVQGVERQAPAPAAHRQTPPPSIAARVGQRLRWRRADPPVDAPDQQPPDARIIAALRLAQPRLTDAAFAEQIRPLVDAFAQSGGPDLSADNPLPNQPSLPDAPVGDGSLLADDEAEANLPQTTTQETSPADRRYPGYTICSTRWDQTLDAKQLYQPDDALNLQHIDETNRQQARRLALRLQRRLCAAGSSTRTRAVSTAVAWHAC